MTKLVNLKSIRERRGWSQQRLADEAKVNVDVIRKQEQGVHDDIYLSSACSLATALEVPIEGLFLPAFSHRTLNSRDLTPTPSVRPASAEASAQEQPA